MIAYKHGTPGEFKLDEAGRVRVAFAQLNVIDSDGDLTHPGAFPTKDVPMSAFGHTSWGGELPPGRGSVKEVGDWGVFEGQFFLDTSGGRDTYLTVKAMAGLQEWSYGYEATEFDFGKSDGRQIRNLRKLDVFEVSPVLKGAGIGTHTLDVKSSKRAIASHLTATSGASWDGPANEARLDSSAASLRSAMAWLDPDGDPDAKASYAFVHHFVGADGDVGSASTVACSSAIGILNGGRGAGSDARWWDSRSGIHAHLARHLRDADLEPPELRAAIPEALPTETDPEGDAAKAAWSLQVAALIEESRLYGVPI